jgi:hypothetical protein
MAAVPANAAAKRQAIKKSNSRLIETPELSVAYYDIPQSVKNWILAKCHTRKFVPVGKK